MSIFVTLHGPSVSGSLLLTEESLGNEFWHAVMGGAESDEKATRLLIAELQKRGIAARLVQFDWPSQSAQVWVK